MEKAGGLLENPKDRLIKIPLWIFIKGYTALTKLIKRLRK